MTELTRTTFRTGRKFGDQDENPALYTQSMSQAAAKTCKNLIDHHSVVFPQSGAFELANLLIAQNEALVTELIEETLNETTDGKQLFSQLFSKTAATLGLMWERDQCSFADVTLGMSCLHRQFRRNSKRLRSYLEPIPERRRALITPIPGDDHIFAATLVAEYFKAAGWHVYSGINFTHSAVLRACTKEDFDFIGISVSANERLYDASQLIHDIRCIERLESVPILVGGLPFQTDITAAAQIGADHAASNVIEALEIAEKLPPRSGAN